MNIYESQTDGQPGQTQQKQPGIESQMNPLPVQPTNYIGSGKLKNRIALITGEIAELGVQLLLPMQKKGHM